MVKAQLVIETNLLSYQDSVLTIKLQGQKDQFGVEPKFLRYECSVMPLYY